MRNMQRRTVRRALAGVVVAATAVGGVVAAVPAQAADRSGIAAAGPDQRVLAWGSLLPAFSAESVRALKCPPGTYLINQDYSPGRWVVRGVEVVEPGSVGVTIPNPATQRSADGQWDYAVGTQFNEGFSSATNWNPFAAAMVEVYLHCTEDPARALKYRAPING